MRARHPTYTRAQLKAAVDQAVADARRSEEEKRVIVRRQPRQVVEHVPRPLRRTLAGKISARSGKFTLRDLYQCNSLAPWLATTLPCSTKNLEVPGTTKVRVTGTATFQVNAGSSYAIFFIPTTGQLGYSSVQSGPIPFISNGSDGATQADGNYVYLCNPPRIPLAGGGNYAEVIRPSNDGLNCPGVNADDLVSFDTSMLPTLTTHVEDPYEGKQRFIRYLGGHADVSTKVSYTAIATNYAVGQNELRNGLGHATGAFVSNDGNPVDSVTKYGNPLVAGGGEYLNISAALSALMEPDVLTGGSPSAERHYHLPFLEDQRFAKMGCTKCPLWSTITDDWSVDGQDVTLISRANNSSGIPVAYSTTDNMSPGLVYNAGGERPDKLSGTFYNSDYTSGDDLLMGEGDFVTQRFGITSAQLAKDCKGLFVSSCTGTGSVTVTMHVTHWYAVAQNPTGELAVLNSSVMPIEQVTHPMLGGMTGQGPNPQAAKLESVKASVSRASEVGAPVTANAAKLAIHATIVPKKKEILSSLVPQSRPTDIIGDQHPTPEATVPDGIVGTVMGLASKVAAPVLSVAEGTADDAMEAVKNTIGSVVKDALPDVGSLLSGLF